MMRSNGDAADMPTISVILPVYNDQVGAARCLRALERQSLRTADFEVIVVDNRSDPPVDLSSDIITLHVLREPRAGPYAARNHGARHAGGRYLAFIDADCIPRHDFLERGLATVRSTSAGHVAGAVRVYARSSVEPASWEQPAPVLEAQLEHAVRAGGNAVERYEKAVLFDQRTNALRNHYAATANAWIEHGTFDRVGEFDATLRSGGDREWGDRAYAMGVATAFAPDVVVYHAARSEWPSLRGRAHRLTLGRFERRPPGWRRRFVRTRVRYLLLGSRSIVRAYETWSQRLGALAVCGLVQTCHLYYFAKYHIADPYVDIQPER